jgi:YVTN family beta-propeller protein
VSSSPALLRVGFAVGWWAMAQTRRFCVARDHDRARHAGVPDPPTSTARPPPASSAPAVEGALPRVYVPNRRANTVSVIDPATLQVIDTFKVGPQSAARRAVMGPQDAVGRQQCRGPHRRQPDADRSLTGRPGAAIPVDDPYNVYSSPDGALPDHRRERS